MTLRELFSAIANAIRSKKGTNAQIIAETFPNEILGISPSEIGNIQTNKFELFLTGEYGYFSSDFCEQVMNGTYELGGL